MWIDADAAIINFNQPLDAFLNKCEHEKDFYIAGNIKGWRYGKHVEMSLHGTPSGLNAGIWFVRDSDYTNEFLNFWLHQSVHNLRSSFLEQDSLQMILDDNLMDFQNRVCLITPSKSFNREDVGQDDVCEFILHLWGSQSSDRISVFREIVEGKKPNINIVLPYFNVYV